MKASPSIRWLRSTSFSNLFREECYAQFQNHRVLAGCIFDGRGCGRKPETFIGPSFDQTVDRVVERERGFVVTMKRMHPLAETYIQNLHEDNDHNAEPVSDQYFLGRLDLNDGVRDSVFQKQHQGFLHHVVNPFSSALEYKFLPQGFAQMVIARCRFPEE